MSASNEVDVIHHVGVSASGTILVAIALNPSTHPNLDSFELLAQSSGIAPFMRRVLAITENELGLTSYHLRVVPWQDGPAGGPACSEDKGLTAFLFSDGSQPICDAAARHGFFIYCAGTNAKARYVPAIGNVDDLDAPIIYQDATGKCVEVDGLTLRSVLVRGEEPDAVVRCSLDFQGRCCYVLVIAPAAQSAVSAKACGEVVRRQSELSDAELAELWRASAAVAESHGGFQEMHLNAGSFQNVAHLHLKVWIPEAQFVSRWADQDVFQKLRSASSKKRRIETREEARAPIIDDEDADLAAAIAMSLE
eukprot:TRINITY_DN822_c0_g2_i1.p1 TRINITY_DN822_c0_g2~~TRINITY_DN822_c0_g2_i1.p1  ORF type:complete len:308 (+),score=42.86 TRINITY_DN822_c0_g2_i1:946-1869(+)